MSFELLKDLIRLGALRCVLVLCFVSMPYAASWCINLPRCVTLRLGVLTRLDALRCVLMSSFASISYVASWCLDFHSGIYLQSTAAVSADAAAAVDTRASKNNIKHGGLKQL